jgi:hypothetical protein
MQAQELTRRSESHQPGPVESVIGSAGPFFFVWEQFRSRGPWRVTATPPDAFYWATLFGFESGDRIPSRLRKQVSYPVFFTVRKIKWEQIDNIEGNYRDNNKGEKRGALQS